MGGGRTATAVTLSRTHGPAGSDKGRITVTGLCHAVRTLTMLAVMSLSSEPLQRAQHLFRQGVAANDIIDELQQEFALDPSTAIAAVATIVLVAAQSTSIDQPMVRPFLGGVLCSQENAR